MEELEGSADFTLFLGLLYHLKHPLLGLERVAALSDTMLLETIVAPGEGPYLWLKPPQEGVHYVPKWMPTVECLEDMLSLVGYKTINRLPYAAKSRELYWCAKT